MGQDSKVVELHLGLGTTGVRLLLHRAPSPSVPGSEFNPRTGMEPDISFVAYAVSWSPSTTVDLSAPDSLWTYLKRLSNDLVPLALESD